MKYEKPVVKKIEVTVKVNQKTSEMSSCAGGHCVKSRSVRIPDRNSRTLPHRWMFCLCGKACTIYGDKICSPVSAFNPIQKNNLMSGEK